MVVCYVSGNRQQHLCEARHSQPLVGTASPATGGGDAAVWTMWLTAASMLAPLALQRAAASALLAFQAGRGIHDEGVCGTVLCRCTAVGGLQAGAPWRRGAAAADVMPRSPRTPSPAPLRKHTSAALCRSLLPQGVELGLRCMAAAGARTVLTMLNSPAGRFTFTEPTTPGVQQPEGARALPLLPGSAAGGQDAFEEYLGRVAETGVVPLQMPLFCAHQMGTCRLGEPCLPTRAPCLLDDAVFAVPRLGSSRQLAGFGRAAQGRTRHPRRWTPLASAGMWRACTAWTAAPCPLPPASTR